MVRYYSLLRLYSSTMVNNFRKTFGSVFFFSGHVSNFVCERLEVCFIGSDGNWTKGMFELNYVKFIWAYLLI